MDMKKSLENMEAVKLFQRNEITEHFVYSELAKRAKGKNAKVLRKIANDEL